MRTIKLNKIYDETETIIVKNRNKLSNYSFSPLHGSNSYYKKLNIPFLKKIQPNSIIKKQNLSNFQIKSSEKKINHNNYLNLKTYYNEDIETERKNKFLKIISNNKNFRARPIDSIIIKEEIPILKLKSEKKMSFNEINKEIDYYQDILKASLFYLKKMKTSKDLSFKNSLLMKREKDKNLTKAFIKLKKRRMTADLSNKLNFLEYRQPSKYLVEKFRKTIYFIIDKFDKLNLTFKEFITKNVFSSIPYEKKYSVNFINYCKQGKEEEINNLLIKNKYLVHDFDHARFTALHWVAKRNFPNIVLLLLKNGAEVDALDMAGRSPLFLATKYNNIECVKILLKYKSNPNLKSFGKKTPFDYTDDLQIKSLLKKSSKLLFLLSLQKRRLRKQFWKIKCNILYYNNLKKKLLIKADIYF